jgi:hypothetical protein
MERLWSRAVARLAPRLRPDRNDGPVYDSLLTISLSGAANGATTLKLVHDQLDSLAVAPPEVAESVDRGWVSALDKLAAIVKENA